RQSDRVGLDVAAEAGVIVAVAVVVEVGEGAHLAGEAEDGVVGGGHDRAAAVGGDERHAELVPVYPVKGRARSRPGDQGQRGIASDTVVAAQRLAAVRD